MRGVTAAVDRRIGVREPAAVIEPAFWLGQARTQKGTFIDYFNSLLGWERFRSSQFGIAHYCAIGLNSKEANNERLAAEVLELVPRFALKEGVVAIGEIGYDEITPAEERAYIAQLRFAVEHDMVVMVHSPHRDKKRGIRRSIDVARECGLPMEKLVIDHYGPRIPIGGGALCGKDTHKPDRVGPLRARQLAVRLAQATGSVVTLHTGWLPGLEAPDRISAHLGDGRILDRVAIERLVPIPDLSLAGSVRDLELASVPWVRCIDTGYMGAGYAWG